MLYICCCYFRFVTEVKKLRYNYDVTTVHYMTIFRHNCDEANRKADDC